MSNPIGMDQAKAIALERVKKDHPEAPNPEVSSTELKPPNWVVKGSWTQSTTNSVSSTNFDIWVDAASGEVIKADYSGGMFVGVG